MEELIEKIIALAINDLYIVEEVPPCYIEELKTDLTKLVNDYKDKL